MCCLEKLSGSELAVSLAARNKQILMVKSFLVKNGHNFYFISYMPVYFPRIKNWKNGFYATSIKLYLKLTIIMIIQPWINNIIWCSRRLNSFIWQIFRFPRHNHIIGNGFKTFNKCLKCGKNLWSIFNKIFCTIKNTIFIHQIFC